MSSSQEERDKSQDAPPGQIRTSIVVGAVYRHFKGGLYRAEGVARHSETGEWMVLYRNVVRLDDGTLHDGDVVWVRPIGMWDQAVMYNGFLCTRFSYVAMPRMTLEEPPPSRALGETT